VELGDSCTVNLLVLNQSRKQQDIKVERIPTQDGFSTREVDFTIPGHSIPVNIPITWEPREVGVFSRTMQFMWFHPRFKRRMAVKLHGRCYSSGDGGHFGRSILNTSAAYLRRGRIVDTSHILASDENLPPARMHRVQMYSAKTADGFRKPMVLSQRAPLRT